MLETFSKALAPGTYANRQKQAHSYITFAVLYNVSYMCPTPVHICMYAQYLANKFDSVSSVKNYMSGARTWVLEHGGNTSAFLGYENSMMLKAINKDSNHVVNRAFPLALSHVHRIVSYLDKARNAPLCVKPCILIGFSCYLRSSNLVCPTLSTLTGPHTLRSKNVIDTGSALKIVITSTKTKMLPYTIMIPFCDDPILCPVRAWRTYKSQFSLNPEGPAFVINGITPLSAGLVVSIMRDALSGFQNIDVSRITMHSLRRGAVQQASSQGCSIPEIMCRGGWSSRSGVRPYLSK